MDPAPRHLAEGLRLGQEEEGGGGGQGTGQGHGLQQLQPQGVGHQGLPGRPEGEGQTDSGEAHLYQPGVYRWSPTCVYIGKGYIDEVINVCVYIGKGYFDEVIHVYISARGISMKSFMCIYRQGVYR